MALRNPRVARQPIHGPQFPEGDEWSGQRGYYYRICHREEDKVSTSPALKENRENERWRHVGGNHILELRTGVVRTRKLCLRRSSDFGEERDHVT